MLNHRKSLARVSKRLAVLGCLVAAAFFGGCASKETEPTGTSAASLPEALVVRGERVARSKACSDCHQDVAAPTATLAGRDGGAARPFGPNLTPDVDTGLGDWSDDDLAHAIRDGVDDEGAELCESMPRFSDLPDDDLDALIAYLRSLPRVTHEVRGSCSSRATSSRGRGLGG
jgi:mono/diheme cytochrome c family protein